MLSRSGSLYARCIKPYLFAGSRNNEQCTFTSVRKLNTIFGSPALLGRKLPECRQCFANQLRRQTATVGGSTGQVPLHAQRAVGRWLVGCAGMCFGAVVIGGITRLTESGLSMTQWHLIKGMKPPQTQDEWEAEFERYKSYPEYKYLERELTLDGFKNIFFWEYIHRMWGRTVGLVFALPALYFLRKGYIAKSLKPRLLIYGTLIGCQGLLGWYMVKSGLQEQPESTSVPRVSQYRLAAHLGSAFILYTLFLYQGLSNLITPQQIANTRQIALLRKFAHGSMVLVFFTAVSGAFVAGMDAGLVYNTWPKMADRWIPDDLLALSPKWINIFENATTVQFDHRILGKLTAGAILGIWAFSRKLPLAPRARMAANALAGMALVQVGLGVATLLSYVPVHLAATHQAGSLVLLSFAVWLTHELKRLPK